MAKVCSYYTGTEAEYFVDRLPFPEPSTWNQHGSLTSAGCS